MVAGQSDRLESVVGLTGRGKMSVNLTCRRRTGYRLSANVRREALFLARDFVRHIVGYTFDRIAGLLRCVAYLTGRVRDCCILRNFGVAHLGEEIDCCDHSYQQYYQ